MVIFTFTISLKRRHTIGNAELADYTLLSYDIVSTSDHIVNNGNPNVCIHHVRALSRGTWQYWSFSYPSPWRRSHVTASELRLINGDRMAERRHDCNKTVRRLNGHWLTTVECVGTLWWCPLWQFIDRCSDGRTQITQLYTFIYIFIHQYTW